MQFEKFTVKGREAIAEAQRLAGRLGNPEIRPGHLLASLLMQDGGVVPSVIRTAGRDPSQIETETAKVVDGYSKVSGGAKAGLSRDFHAVLESAERESKNNGDSHISSEMMLVGVAAGTSKAQMHRARRLLAQQLEDQEAES